MKYSFIIPVYNSEKYIIKCLKSICEDIKNEDYEIIIVENGSTDLTTKVVENFIEENNYNIHLYHSKKGVSNARNYGIRVSDGRYIIFVDSDDEWISGSIEKIKEDINKNKYELGVYSYFKGKTNQNNCIKVTYNSTINNKSANEIKNWIISNPTLRASIWSKVFDSKIIKKYNVLFDETLQYAEDSEFLIRYMQYTQKINVFSKEIYKYNITDNSTVRSSNSNKVAGYIKALERAKETLKNENKNTTYALNKYILCNLNILLVHEVFNLSSGEKIKDEIKKCKKIINEDIFNTSLRNISIRSCFSKNLLPELFLKLHLYYLLAILCILKNKLNSK